MCSLVGKRVISKGYMSMHSRGLTDDEYRVYKCAQSWAYE